MSARLSHVSLAVRVAVIAALAASALGAALFVLGGVSRWNVQAGRPAVGDREARADLLITRDFGNRTLAASETLVPPGSSVLDVLSANAKVETAYGGGFVNAINGLASGYTGGGSDRSDWFYYVDGLQASVGSADLKLYGGERVWWDYHFWAASPSVPAIVGQYPRPFATGRAEEGLSTVVVSTYESADYAAAIARALSDAGARQVTRAALSPSLEPSANAHLVLVGTWKRLLRVGWVADIARHPLRAGLFGSFDVDSLDIFDGEGRIARRLIGAGAVQATARADAPKAAIWLVSGHDPDTVARAAGLFRRPDAFEGRFGVAITRNGVLVSLPARPGEVN